MMILDALYRVILRKDINSDEKITRAPNFLIN